MRMEPTRISGLFTVRADPHEDERGGFRRLWCAESFAKVGLDFAPVQSSLSTNHRRHTLRGLHWQAPPCAEQKLVRCLRGAIWDVAVDLRPDQPTYLQWHAERLDAENACALFLPRGVAHGFLTLTDGAEVEYLIDTAHAPDCARGARWNDPAFAIHWPAEPTLLSPRDASWRDHGDG